MVEAVMAWITENCAHRIQTVDSLKMTVYVYLFFEIIAFLTAVFQYPQIKETQYRYFIPYLLFIVIYEIGTILNWFSIHHRNLWLANFTMTLSFLFYCLFLRTIVKSQPLKRWIKRLVFLSIFCLIIDELFVQGFWDLDTIIILLEYGIIIFIVCFYFYELIDHPEHAMSIIKVPAFWLNTGLLFFCLAQFLFFSAFAYMAYKNDYNYYILFSVISNLANAILYSCLTAAFLCFNTTTNQLSS
jgi:hypothetical protein